MIVPDNFPSEWADWIVQFCDENEQDVSAVGTAVFIYSYLEEDGSVSWNYHVRGEDQVLHVVGLLELVKTTMTTPLVAKNLEDYGESEGT